MDNKYQFLELEQMFYIKSLPPIIRINYMKALYILNSDDPDNRVHRNKMLRSINIDPNNYRPKLTPEKLDLITSYCEYTLFEPSSGILN